MLSLPAARSVGGPLRDLRAALSVGRNGPSDDPDSELDGVRATPLSPTRSRSPDRADDPSLHTRQCDLERQSDRDIKVGSGGVSPLLSTVRVEPDRARFSTRNAYTASSQADGWPDWRAGRGVAGMGGPSE